MTLTGPFKLHYRKVLRYLQFVVKLVNAGFHGFEDGIGVIVFTASPDELGDVSLGFGALRRHLLGGVEPNCAMPMQHPLTPILLRSLLQLLVFEKTLTRRHLRGEFELMTKSINQFLNQSINQSSPSEG